jgi:hypothetical protein
MDNIRVMRLLIYEGPRDRVEDVVRRSLHGTKVLPDLTIRALDLQDFPEVFTSVYEPLAFGEVDPRD